MKDFIVKPTRCTPGIKFYFSKNQLEISGESYPENTSEFYAPVFEKLKIYFSGIEEQAVTLTIHLSYFNSSSSKIFINLFDFLEEWAEKGKNITVNWMYRPGDTDTREFGEEFSDDLDFLKFMLVSTG